MDAECVVAAAVSRTWAVIRASVLGAVSAEPAPREAEALPLAAVREACIDDRGVDGDHEAGRDDDGENPVREEH
ncbi:hypothetical protein [Streptomyces sp. NBC_00344]|uniref:hypothetical protein n=1 Tax=Streptomyces sp. NBC_00344 TaxID=2975720 RepID=UPI002E246F0C